jgi:hypothetical protein
MCSIGSLLTPHKFKFSIPGSPSESYTLSTKENISLTMKSILTKSMLSSTTWAAKSTLDQSTEILHF